MLLNSVFVFTKRTISIKKPKMPPKRKLENEKYMPAKKENKKADNHEEIPFFIEKIMKSLDFGKINTEQLEKCLIFYSDLSKFYKNDNVTISERDFNIRARIIKEFQTDLEKDQIEKRTTFGSEPHADNLYLEGNMMKIRS